jgi:hypothetical protein
MNYFCIARRKNEWRGPNHFSASLLDIGKFSRDFFEKKISANFFYSNPRVELVWLVAGPYSRGVAMDSC